MSVAVALIRHGAYEQPAGVPSAHLPHPLTDEGIAQARRGAAAIEAAATQRGLTIAPLIDSSPLLRAWQTADLYRECIAAPSLAVREVDALCERSLGSAANLTVEDIERIIERDPRRSPLPEGWKRAPDVRLPLPGAESLRDAGRRVAAHLSAVASELAGSADGPLLKLVIGHGGSMRHAAAALGVLDEDGLHRLSMHHCRAVVLWFDGERWSHRFGDWKQRDLRAPDNH